MYQKYRNLHLTAWIGVPILREPFTSMRPMNTPMRRFVRLSEIERREIRVWIDGHPTKALEGDTLLVALLSNTGHLRTPSSRTACGPASA